MRIIEISRKRWSGEDREENVIKQTLEGKIP